MREVILSADGDSVVYLVPDEVANDLRKYCLEFSNVWLVTSKKARRRYKIRGGYCYNEADFIDYLNEEIFLNQKSVFVKNLGWTNLGDNLPAEYKDYPYFNF